MYLCADMSTMLEIQVMQLTKNDPNLCNSKIMLKWLVPVLSYCAKVHKRLFLGELETKVKKCVF